MLSALPRTLKQLLSKDEPVLSPSLAARTASWSELQNLPPLLVSPPFPSPHLRVPLPQEAAIVRRHERAVELRPEHARYPPLWRLDAEDGL